MYYWGRSHGIRLDKCTKKHFRHSRQHICAGWSFDDHKARNACGFGDADLNIGNILANFAKDSETLDGYFLIDFALYKAGMPLLYDQRYLEMSYLIRELERAPFPKWVSFVDHFSRQDMPNPKEVPAELAVACAVINAGRTSFERWMHETHPSLSDDLWGQFWLAGVAVGLNFCNKTALSTEARLAGLIYSAVHLKRY